MLYGGEVTTSWTLSSGIVCRNSMQSPQYRVILLPGENVEGMVISSWLLRLLWTGLAKGSLVPVVFFVWLGGCKLLVFTVLLHLSD